MIFIYALRIISIYVIILQSTQCVGGNMSNKDYLIELRKRTGMNRKEFCAYFEIPYRTMTDWELGNRTMPDYLLRLMAYKIAIEKPTKDTKLT